MKTYETINDILVHLFNEIWELEKNAIITEEFKDITNNDMHIIEAIGLTGKTTKSVVAKKNEDHSRLTYDGNECTGQ